MFYGDFNVPIGAHENFDMRPPNKTLNGEFIRWKNQNRLIYLDMTDSYYTWTNGRKWEVMQQLD